MPQCYSAVTSTHADTLMPTIDTDLHDALTAANVRHSRQLIRFLR